MTIEYKKDAKETHGKTNLITDILQIIYLEKMY